MEKTQPESVTELFAEIEAQGREVTRKDVRQAMDIIDQRMDKLLEMLDRFQARIAGKKKTREYPAISA
ncbi:MAG: hypothetical protein HN416_15255 [Nitrospina sp.]|nr:hypothetical protein [Nitrospina sp.]